MTLKIGEERQFVIRHVHREGTKPTLTTDFGRLAREVEKEDSESQSIDGKELSITFSKRATLSPR
jgi:hypothetical protein